MVLRHFRLREQPFGVTPDPRYLYLSATHREALAGLLYGIESGAGFVTLIAMPGMGKTTILFEVLRRIEANATTVFLFQTITTSLDLLRALLMDLGIDNAKTDMLDLQAQLNQILISRHAAGKRVVVVIDKAHLLNEEVLEAIRLLSNFETSGYKLLQIVLCGQPQLADKLASQSMIQLRQRISICGILQPFSPADSTNYIQHRLRISGKDATEALFTDAALALIAQSSGGIPRNINNICFNAMTLGCVLGRRTITEALIHEVLVDLGYEHGYRPNAPNFSHRLKRNPTSEGKAGAKNESSCVRPLLGAAVASGILALFGWLGIQDYRALRAEATGQADSSADSPFVDTNADTAPEGVRRFDESRTQTLQIQSVNSLRNICPDAIGPCAPETLNQMERFNPSIRDHDHVSAGEWVAIPTTGRAAQESR